ncbi:hypoxanthine-guanine phosphoribosyltransferase [Algiphilus sp. W345]|uniref:Hypoxanthine-guanine phosphoribosyltransferase n=1 Tax=Banduia mediterranea TaxID=3075609 RepID=A0ABU2WH14_9GAMM|nr:hypoxanthine-guanine phosphoribosyltransferase [Algiphilus sp. W345]MDT0497162.1 hypoxanthine-guanine phosphoribosyltransferase [Algiphilus sp. W345]
MSELLDEVRQIRAQADCLHDEAAVNAAYDRLAGRLTAEYATLNPILICVMVGGLVTTAEVSRRLDFPFEIDYLHASRYRGKTSGGELVWKVSPTLPLKGRHVVIVDDILDEGHTLAEVQGALRAQLPESLKTLVLVDKTHSRRAPGVSAEFVGLEVADRYVFGAGMDYKSYWRQLPGIYAVAESNDAPE